ncbi:MAG TPA: periplasmic heavy metal sensor [Armatimonadota bacterium]|nr:periplasmic heavy metal sensor [Armatimonadota bacterium]
MGGHGMKGMRGPFMMMPWKILMHSEELGLSEDQMARIRDTHTNMRKQKVKLHSEIKLLKIDLQNLLMQDQVNMQEIEQKVREMSKLKADMHLAWIQAMQDMRNALTPDQRKQIKSMIMSFWKKGGIAGAGEMPGEPMETEEEEVSESEE